MLGSRKEKFASIFQRVHGLLKNGAIPYEQRPLWYDVYNAFPPREEPTYNRSIPSSNVRNILYQQDIKRSDVFKLYHKLDAFNLFKVEDNRSLLFRILSRHEELLKEHSGATDDDIFQMVESELGKEGFNIKRRM